MVKQLSEVSGYVENPITETLKNSGAATEALGTGSPPPVPAPEPQNTVVPGEELNTPDSQLRPSEETPDLVDVVTGISDAVEVIASGELEELPDTSPDTVRQHGGFFSRVLGDDFNIAPATQRSSRGDPMTASNLTKWALGSEEVTSMSASGSTLVARTLPFVKQGENFYSKAYPDPGSRDGTPWTIGYGQTRINGRPVRPGDTISEPEALRWVTEELTRVESFVRSKVNVPLTEGQLAALTSFTYNVGDGAFSNSTLLRKLNAGDYDSVPSEMRKWVNNDGQFMQGLLNRRNNEINQLWSV